jgi:transketolase
MPHNLSLKKAPLDPTRDAEVIQALKIAAVVHRRKLIDLGHQLNIRLHYGGTMSCVEILNLLYLRWMNLDPGQPDWLDRDRFILSKGHVAPGLYAALWMRGFFPENTFDNFRQLGNPLQGHPDRNKTPGVDSCSGSLGQGLAVGCGMALGAKIDQANYRVYVLMSDGECNEGSTWEAALIAANLKIDRITVLLDWNRKSSYGPMEGRNDIIPLVDKWEAFGWVVLECDGHDYISLSQSMYAAEQINNQPVVVICSTVKGKGIPYTENYPTRSNISLTEPQYREAVAYLSEQGKALSHANSD